MTDAGLEARGGRRYAADKSPGFPCRVSLRDAEPGAPLILLPFEHEYLHVHFARRGCFACSIVRA